MGRVVSSASQWLKVHDEYILSQCSTSPKVEPPYFVRAFKDKFRRMLSDPKPLETIFKDGQSRSYKLNTESGLWELENPERFSSNSSSSSSASSASAFTVKDFVASTRNLKPK